MSDRQNTCSVTTLRTHNGDNEKSEVMAELAVRIYADDVLVAESSDRGLWRSVLDFAIQEKAEETEDNT